MIQLQKLTADDTLFLKKVKKIYESSFPAVERREYKEVKDLLSDQRFSLFAVTFENETVGMLSKWDFQTFVYIEHFAISSVFRGNGLGTYVLQKLIQEDDRQIVLEVELPEDEISLKRIKFYERNGFIICHESYIQPSYDKDKSSLPMMIMVKHAINTLHDFHAIRKTLYQEVYGFFETSID